MKPASPLTIYKQLPKTNCRKCGSPSCLAFAAALVQKQTRPQYCPFLDQELVEQLSAAIAGSVTADEKHDEKMSELKRQLAGVDLASRAAALGARYSGGQLIIQCLGRDFAVDAQGRIASHCHTHAWFSIPFLNYILTGQGVDPIGSWVPYRQLHEGPAWEYFFNESCIAPLRQIADRSPELFESLVGIFSGSSSQRYFDADVSVILHPFPKLPLLICYWQPEEELESKLQIFFDRTADRNLHVETIFGLGVSIVRMLEKIVARHL